MSETKHTPGPWEAKRGVGWFVTRPDAVKRREAALAVGMTAATSLVTSPNDWDEENKANAHLMAAAPDLLEACKGVLDRCCGEYPDHPETLALMAAIDKAEGRS